MLGLLNSKFNTDSHVIFFYALNKKMGCEKQKMFQNFNLDKKQPVDKTQLILKSQKLFVYAQKR